MPHAKTARISLYVIPECYEQLRLLSRDTGRQKSDLVADAIAQYYQTVKNLPPQTEISQGV